MVRNWIRFSTFAVFLGAACGEGGSAPIGSFDADAVGSETRSVEDVAEAVGDDAPDADVTSGVDGGEDGGFEWAGTEIPDGAGDWAPAPGAAGWPCSNAGQCDSGFCIHTPDGRQCTMECEDECPFGWVCSLHKPSLPDETYLCAPIGTSLCRPCKTNVECMADGLDAGAKCLDYGPAGAFCGPPCEGENDCPEGYGCLGVPDAGGSNLTACVRTAGECPCTQWFVDVGAETACVAANEWGECEGARQCKAGGLTPCSAPEPSEEECNGKDDDCDGEADDATSGGVCFNTNAAGTCQGVELCQGGILLCDGPEADAETCDGKDNDCDGLTDEAFPDTDGDGVADCLEADVDGDGTPDVLDNCPGIANATQADADLDNFGDACDADDDNDKTADGADCAPFDDSIHPGAEEQCDGKDNDCNLLVDEGFADTDFDSWKNCVDEDDDNDGVIDQADCAPQDQTIYPAAEEQCNGKDDDCDGDVDDGFDDADGDGQADCLDDDTDGDGVDNGADNCAKLSNPGQEDADGDGVGDPCDVDADGDGIPDGLDNCVGKLNPAQGDLDGDGVGDVCDDDADGDGSDNPSDCSPMNPAVFPGGTESCNAADDDCDGDVDEEIGQLACGKGECFHVVDMCKGGVVQACDPFEGISFEVCDGEDNDCDGLTDEDQGAVSCGVGVCFHSTAACVGGKPGKCDPLAGAAAESCDGLDNDCDGKTDEDLGAVTCGLGVCLHTVAACMEGVEQVCDPDLGAKPEWCDGQDNDCDGKADEELGTTTCGKGLCTHTVNNCTGGLPQLCNPLEGSAPETCDGADNDCNGQIDEGFPNLDLDALPDCIDEDDDDDGDADVTDCAPLDPNVGGTAAEKCFNGVDDDCDPVTPDACVLESCKALLEAAPATKTGAYAIDPDGVAGPVAPFQVYCEMSVAGGGWTLVLKAYNGDGSHFYNTANTKILENEAVLNPVSAGVSKEDHKSQAYFTVKCEQLLAMDLSNQAQWAYGNVDNGKKTVRQHILDAQAGGWEGGPNGCGNMLSGLTKSSGGSTSVGNIPVSHFGLMCTDDQMCCAWSAHSDDSVYFGFLPNAAHGDGSSSHHSGIGKWDSDGGDDVYESSNAEYSSDSGIAIFVR